MKLKEFYNTKQKCEICSTRRNNVKHYENGYHLIDARRISKVLCIKCAAGLSNVMLNNLPNLHYTGDEIVHYFKNELLNTGSGRKKQSNTSSGTASLVLLGLLAIPLMLKKKSS